MNYLLKAQYPNGGWPQFYRLRDGYWSRITSNDDAMTGVMETLRAIVEARPEYAFLDEADRARAKRAIDKGVECILKTQLIVRHSPLFSRPLPWEQGVFTRGEKTACMTADFWYVYY